jgi:hypothetical protein
MVERDPRSPAAIDLRGCVYFRGRSRLGAVNAKCSAQVKDRHRVASPYLNNGDAWGQVTCCLVCSVSSRLGYSQDRCSLRDTDRCPCRVVQ